MSAMTGYGAGFVAWEAGANSVITGAAAGTAGGAMGGALSAPMNDGNFGDGIMRGAALGALGGGITGGLIGVNVPAPYAAIAGAATAGYFACGEDCAYKGALYALASSVAMAAVPRSADADDVSIQTNKERDKVTTKEGKTAVERYYTEIMPASNTEQVRDVVAQRFAKPGLVIKGFGLVGLGATELHYGAVFVAAGGPVGWVGGGIVMAVGLVKMGIGGWTIYIGSQAGQ
jgi:hypothetical protein